MIGLDIFLGVLILTAIFIFIYNFIGFQQERPIATLYPEEKSIDTLKTQLIFDKQETTLTNRRLFQVQKKWLFSRNIFTFMDLEEITAISLSEFLNFIIFFIGVIVSFIFMPLGYILILYGLVNHMLRLTVYSTQKKIKITSSLADKDSFRSFITNIQTYAFNVKNKISAPVSGTVVTENTPSKDFKLGHAVILTIILYFIAGILQRLTEGSIKFDDIVFFPLYLAIPLIVGYRNGAWTGFKTGFFGFLTLFTLIFPVPFLALGKSVFIWEYLAGFLMLTMGGMICGILRYVWTGIPVLAAWLVFLYFYRNDSIYDMNTYLQLSIAGFIYTLIAAIFGKKKDEKK